MLCVFKKFMFVHVVLCQFSLPCSECSCCMFIFVSLFTFQIIVYRIIYILCIYFVSYIRQSWHNSLHVFVLYVCNLASVLS